MRSISTADENNIISLLSHGLSTKKIAAQTSISKSKVASVAKDLGSNKENQPGGRSKKLSPHDQRAVSSLWRLGRLLMLLRLPNT
jgi:DNA-binding NarL/FixJ family response regulator